MIRDDRSNEDMLDYLTNETVAFRDSMSSETTGIYGYINGEFMDGSGWVPDEGYDPTERPWYKETKAGNGKIVLGDPYLDMDTGDYTITVGKVLCDAKSVVAVDLFLSQLQAINDEHSDVDKNLSEIIINVRGEIITHSDRSRIGSMISDSHDAIDRTISDNLDRNKESFFYLQNEGKDYIVYIMPLQYNWISITVIDATDDFENLRIPLIITIFTILLFVTILAFFMVISDKRRREARLLAIENERATAASDAKTEFLSNMSHEIRTPINAILGMNEMVLRVSDEKEVLEYSENIRTAGKTLLGIVNDILDFSKIEAGKMEIIPEEYELSSMLNDLVTLIDIRAKKKGLSLELDFDPELPRTLFGDEARIKQVIVNLLTNAVKYTDKGSVRFEVGFSRLAGEKDEILLKVYVRDTGRGIKQEDMHRLFTKFERIEEDKNRNVEGTGLGMSITMNLIRMMGSSLEVESVYEKGSSFGFRLRQHVVNWDSIGDYETTYKHQLEEKEKYHEKFRAPSARVLVVDDNPMNLLVFTSLLKDTGVGIVTCESGDEGIRLSTKEKYDMIFLDHMMPGKDGIETLAEIKQNMTNPNFFTPFICLTANAISGAKEKYLEAGFDDYLTKPIDSAKLENMMIAYLSKEKVTMVESTPDEAGTEETIPEDIIKLEDLGIDINKGIGNSGDVKTYRSFLKVFYDSAADVSKALNGYYEEQDYNNYTVKVHGLKSSARIIGAMDLGEEAQKLEDAGKSEDIDYIRDHHRPFMDKYISCTESMKELLATDIATDAGPEADTELMKDVLENIRSAAEAMDCERLEAVFKDMEGYSIPEEYRSLYDGIKAASDKFDYSGILEILQKER